MSEGPPAGLGNGHVGEPEEPSRPPPPFELAVVVDRPVYSAGEQVRITVAITNTTDRWVEQSYQRGWSRVELTVRDQHHRPVAQAFEDAAPRADTPVADRWAPGQSLLMPIYWHQQGGPLVPAWSHRPAEGRVAPGRYRVRATWRGESPATPLDVGDAHSSWFELV